jgi:hypothetical protein
MYGKELHYKKNNTDIKEFFTTCKFTEEILTKAQSLKDNYKIFKSNNTFEKSLYSQLNGISNTLRQYILDIQTKEELNINSIINFKNELLKLNYPIILFNIKNNTIDDFFIEIGIDSNNEAIVTYDNLELDDTTVVLEPAPFVADKLSEQKDKIWNEFLRLIGIANTSFQKKERNIQDEVFISQAGTIASRYSRFEARREAIDKINKKWNLNIEVEYYDGLPTTLTSPENEYNSVTSEEVYDDRETNNAE